MNELRTGYAENIITPSNGIAIEGYYIPRFAEGVITDLKVIAFVLSTPKNMAVVLSFDLCMIEADLIEKFKNSIKECTGIKDSNIFITATHTHTGPCLKANNLFLCDEKPIQEYINFLIKTTTKTVKEAVADLRPTQMGYSIGKAPERIAYIRRYKMKDGSTMTCPPINDDHIDYPLGTLDQRVNVLRFDRENADSVVVLNYGIHVDTVGGNKISSDWVGWTQGTLSKALDGVKCICIMGAQGDVGSTNVFPTISDMNDTEISFDNEMKSPGMARFVGRALAGVVLQVYDKVEYIDVHDVNILMEEIDVELNKAEEKDLPLAHKYKQLHEKGCDNLIPYKAMELTTVVAEAMRMCRLENYPNRMKISMVGLKIGDIALIGIPGEPFTETGVAIKEIGGFDLILPCALTNGYEGYFPSKEAYDEGGYEARTSIYKKSVSESIVNCAKKILGELNQ